MSGREDGEGLGVARGRPGPKLGVDLPLVGEVERGLTEGLGVLIRLSREWLLEVWRVSGKKIMKNYMGNCYDGC